MNAIHTERAFENAIEHDLLAAGYLERSSSDFDPTLGLDRNEALAFIQALQPETWTWLEKHLGAATGDKVIDALIKALDAPRSGGTLDVLRHGFKFYGKTLKLAAFRPASGLNPDVLADYAKNRLAITRQVRIAQGSQESIDMMLSLNGLPIATLELKNPSTGQSVEDAKKQYERRDPRHTLFRFKHRALVHFAVDPERVYMTTKLAGASTFFLPFNRGRDGGAGNPDAPPGGHRTSYLWREVLAPDSLLDIVARFVHLERSDEGSEKLIFPRYHQLDVVRRLEAAARAEGPGRSYLVQHSAGSGKSNSIAWLAHRLASLHDAKDEKVFDSVVVITDRRVLDKQLQDTIYQFEHKQGVVERIEQDSGQLARALAERKPIIITTLQKFPFVTEKIGELPARTYALIIDEAHSSQSGESAAKMRKVLGAGHDADSETTEDLEERILEAVKARGRQPNLSMFAFTATPKHKTLEIFAHGDDGARPFHVYTMRQAIEEGFILDVLENYTTYKTYYRLIKRIEDDPELDKRQAARALARFMSLHPYNIAQKVEVIVEHFRRFTRHKLGGRAKAMVVTRSRMHAVRFKQAFDRYVREHGYADELRALVAFSGTVNDEVTSQGYTTLGLNPGLASGTPEEIKETFAGTDHHVLIVAEMFQTGFDQPLLHTMYVDKRLSGIQAVQTLSRLNRKCPGKEDTFVLDFVNEADEVREAFAPFYEQTVIAEQADPQHLYELMRTLDDRQVYHLSELDAFCKVFFKPESRQRSSDHAELERHLAPAFDRFRALDEAAQDEFRRELGAFVRLYAFLSQVLPYPDADLEKRYVFGRLLAGRLPRQAGSARIEFNDEVALKHYRLHKTFEGSIVLPAGEHKPVKGPTAVGTGKERPDPVRLSSLVELINERYGLDLTDEHLVYLDALQADSERDEALRQSAQVNRPDNFLHAFKAWGRDRVVEALDEHQDLVLKLLGDERAFDWLLETMGRRAYARFNEQGEVDEAGGDPLERIESSTPSHDATATAPGAALAPPPMSDELDDARWAEILDLLDERWVSLAVGLRAAGLPAPDPDHVDLDLMVQDRTSGERAVLLWPAEAGFLALVESATGLDECSGELVEVAPDITIEPVAQRIEGWLAAYR